MAGNPQKSVKTAIEKNFNLQVKFLQKLVRTKSANPFTSENSSADEPVELEVARLIKNEIKKIGFSAEFKGASPKRPNVVCKIKGSEKKTLILNGHMDTVVPCDGWSGNPYGGEIKNGKLFGVGALDMKASLAIFVFLAKAIADLKLKLKGNLALTFVVDEEPGACSPFGAKYLLRHGLKGNAAIVAEPMTEKICIGHKGIYRFKLGVFGEAIHSGLSQWEKGAKGKNAIVEMSRAIEALQKIKIPFNSSPVFPNRKPVFTFPTKIQGGKSINVVPALCEAYGDARTMPGISQKQIRKLIVSKLDNLKIRYKLKDLLFVPAVEISKDEEIVRMLLKNSKSILKRSPVLGGIGPCTDAWMFIQKGIPAICAFGPDGENFHAKDEFVCLESVKKVTEIYLRTVIDFLGVN